WPAALRLIWRLLLRLSPKTVSVPLLGWNDAVTAALAVWLRPMITPAPITVPKRSLRDTRLQSRVVFMDSPVGLSCCGGVPTTGGGGPRLLRQFDGTRAAHRR